MSEESWSRFLVNKNDHDSWNPEGMEKGVKIMFVAFIEIFFGTGVGMQWILMSSSIRIVDRQTFRDIGSSLGPSIDQSRKMLISRLFWIFQLRWLRIL